MKKITKMINGKGRLTVDETKPPRSLNSFKVSELIPNSKVRIMKDD